MLSGGGTRWDSRREGDLDLPCGRHRAPLVSSEHSPLRGLAQGVGLGCGRAGSAAAFSSPSATALRQGSPSLPAAKGTPPATTVSLQQLLPLWDTCHPRCPSAVLLFPGPPTQQRSWHAPACLFTQQSHSLAVCSSQSEEWECPSPHSRVPALAVSSWGREKTQPLLGPCCVPSALYPFLFKDTWQ